MALDTSKAKLPLSIVTEIAGKVKGSSTIAALSPSEPQLFADRNYMIFNRTAEAEVVAEGAKKGVYEQTLTPVAGKIFKVVTTTRVSDELKWADEDNKLEIIDNIQRDQAEQIGRALDYVVYHAINPKDKSALSGFTALTAGATAVAGTADAVADLDSMVDAVAEYGINGIAIDPKFAAALRKVRAEGTGTRIYPEIPLDLRPGQIDGIRAASSVTVSGDGASLSKPVSAIMGNFDMIKWGLVRDMWTEVIEYGDPDGTGVDLKSVNQVAYRTEAVFSYAVLDPKAFAVLNTSSAATASARSK